MKKITITFLALFIGAYGLFSQTNWEWTLQESGTTSALKDVYFANNMTGWAVGSEGTILKTSDGGNNWSAQTSGTVEELQVVHFIDENIGWITGGGVSSEQAPLLKTTDGGDNWQELSFGFSAFFVRDIFFVDANVGWALKADTIYRSTDGGITWQAEDFAPTVTTSSLNNKEIFATSNSIAYVAGRNDNGAANSAATIFDRRPDNAYLWGTDGLNQFDNDEVLECITFANDSVGFAGGQMGKLYRMQQSGEMYYNGPWQLNLELEPGNTIRSISFPNTEVGMFNTTTEINTVTIALVYHTEDQGENWTSAPDSIPDMLSAKLFASDENNAWIVALGGKIYKGVPGPSSIFDNHTEINFSLFPNPTTGLVTINNPDKYNKLTVSVTNLMGQLISDFVMENADNAEININGQPGIYFVKAVNEKGGQRVIKVIKE
ncbi:MAG: T9SS type A sorting domain-containing protein [Bacteroidales bacterium]|nr:T9SS type A sorting domain-containing protein [Bacteroidales bacterium]